MCIYTVKKQIFLKTPPNVPKLGIPGVKDTAKPNKDLGICHVTYR